MNIIKQDIGVWVKASEELPPTKQKVTIRDTNSGFVYQDSANNWDKKFVDYEWLKPIEQVYVLSKDELKNIWDACLNYYKSEYKMEKDTANNQMKPQPNFEQFIQSITTIK